jgi:hypothetical protein
VILCSVILYWTYDRESVEREWPDVRCFPIDTPEQRQVLVEVLQKDLSIRVAYGYGPPGESPYSLAQYLWRSDMNGVFANLAPTKEAFAFLDRVRLAVLRCRPEDEAAASEFHRALIATTDDHETALRAMRITDELCSPDPSGAS